MFGLGAQNASSLQKKNVYPWFTDPSLRLGGVFPSLVHEYDNNRYAVGGTVTNVNTYSQDFDDASYNKVRTTLTPNATTAPDGTLTADALIEDTTPASTHALTKVIQGPLGVGDALTVSFYVKPNGRNFFKFQIPTGIVSSGPIAVFDLVTGVSSNSGTATTKATFIGDGWVRCSMTAIATTAGASGQINSWLSIDAANLAYDGDGVSGVYIWGMQAEYSLTANRYVPTTSTSASVTTPLSATPFPFTATRAGNATQVTSNGTIDWAPANMYNRSNLLTDSVWNKNTATVVLVSGEVAPTGDSVFKLIVNNGTSTTANDAAGGFWQLITGLANKTPVCFSFYAKAAENTAVKIRENVSTGVRVKIDLTDGTVVYESGNFTQMQCYANYEGDGWYRIHCTYILAAAATTALFEMKGGDDTGDGVSGVYISSPQHELWGLVAPKKYCSSGTSTAAVYKPRFDYNPLTLASRGVLIEKQATNNILDQVWVGTTAATLTTAPTPIMGWRAQRATWDGTVSGHFVFASTTTQSGSTVYTASAYLRSVTAQYVQIASTAQATLFSDYANFDIINGTVTAVGATATAEIVDCGNGVFRCSMTYTSVAAPLGGSPLILFGLVTGLETRAPSMATSDSFDFALTQHETGSFMSSIIPTYGTAATRTGDTLDFTTTLPYNASGTSYYVEFERAGFAAGSTPEASGGLFYFGTFGGNNISAPYGFGTPSQTRFDLQTAGVTQAALSTTVIPVLTVAKAMTRLQTNNARAAFNGVLTTLDTAATMPTSMPETVKAMGRRESATHQMSGWLREFRIYESAVSDADLTAETTL